MKTVRHFGKQYRAGPWTLAVLASLLLVSAPVVAEDLNISVPGLFNGKAVVVINGKRHILGVGERSPEGLRLESINDNGITVVVNGEQRNIPMGMAAQVISAPETAEVRIQPDASGMYYIRGQINNRSVQFLVDTGANSVAMSSLLARQIGLDFVNRNRETTVSTASGVARAWQITLDKVQIGNIILTNVVAVVIEGIYPREVLLGNSFLDQVELVRQGRLMMLRKSW